jgi:hypothetical protein
MVPYGRFQALPLWTVNTADTLKVQINRIDDIPWIGLL